MLQHSWYHARADDLMTTCSGAIHTTLHARHFGAPYGHSQNRAVERTGSANRNAQSRQVNRARGDIMPYC